MGKKGRRKKSKDNVLHVSLAEQLAAIKPRESRGDDFPSFSKEEEEKLDDCDLAWQEWQSNHPVAPVESLKKNSHSVKKLHTMRQRDIHHVEESSEVLFRRLQKLSQESAIREKELIDKVAHLEEVLARLRCELVKEKERADDCLFLLQKEEEKSESERLRAQKFLDEREAIRADMLAQKTTFQSLSSLLEESKIPSELWVSCLLSLAKHRASEMLDAFHLEEVFGRTLLKGFFALCCGHSVCSEGLSAPNRHLLCVDKPELCHYCSGSRSQRAFFRMVDVCKERGCKKIIIVGGELDVLNEIRRLSPPGFLLRIITGHERRSQQQANNDMRFADLVVVWVSSGLPHKISELYTKKRSSFPRKVVLVSRSGLLSLSSSVIHFLEKKTHSC